MLILSRIIIKEWFKSLFGAVTVLFLLITTADLINGFLQGKEASRVFLEYSLKMPDLMGKMLPICCLVASLFSINRLKAHSELISILAAGYSYQKIYFLIGICSSLIASAQFINLGVLEPFANSIKRKEIAKSKISEGRFLTRSSLEGGKFWYKSGNYFGSFSYFDGKTKSFKDLMLYFFNQDHQGMRIIKATEAVYLKDRQWILKNAAESSKLDNLTFPIQTLSTETMVELNETPEDFGEFEADLTTLNYFKLNDFVRRLSKTGINVNEYKIILMNKIFLSFSCLVFALLPLSSIFNPNRRSSSFGKNVVQTLLITVTFWVLYSSCVAMGNSGKIPPWLATGAVPMFFLSFVLVTFLRNRKLSI